MRATCNARNSLVRRVTECESERGRQAKAIGVERGGREGGALIAAKREGQTDDRFELFPLGKNVREKPLSPCLRTLLHYVKDEGW